jgi:integrase
MPNQLCNHFSHGFTYVIEAIPIPDFPKIKYTLGYRNILDVKDQASVLNEIHRISYSFNPRIYIGILWLCTYPGIRPNEMRNLKEKHINMNGYLILPTPKEKRYKKIAMSEDDIDLYQSIRPIGKPDMYFFRHIKGNGTAKPGNQFGKDYFYKWWKSACKNLGIEGVDLYGGTRHSTLSMLQTDLSEEEIMRHASMHSSNIALRRYIRGDYKSQINVQKYYETSGKGF